MAMIYVRTKPGRKAFFQGKVIPQDKFVPVPDPPYIRRLVKVWGDLDVQGGDEKPKSKAAAPTYTPPKPAA